MPKQRVSDSERRKRFFYAEADANLYDAGVDLNTPLYGLVNRTLLELLENHFRSLGTRRRDRVVGHFLDIGSGTGGQTLTILERFPSLKGVTLDLCEPMHKVLESKVIKALGQRAFEDRCTLITGDIMSSAGSPRSLLKPLDSKEKSGKYRAVVSAFALHHLSDREKIRAYQRIFDVLEPGGLFLNADLFSFQSASLKRQAQEFTISYINKQHVDPDPEFREAFLAVGDDRERLRKAWVLHCNRHNLPAPVESVADGLARHLRIGCQDGQASMLVKAGFSEVGCPLRYWQVGILWGRK